MSRKVNDLLINPKIWWDFFAA